MCSNQWSTSKNFWWTITAVSTYSVSNYFICYKPLTETVQEGNSMALPGVCLGKEQKGRKSSHCEGHGRPVQCCLSSGHLHHFNLHWKQNKWAEHEGEVHFTVDKCSTGELDGFSALSCAVLLSWQSNRG